jgi:hypothetical protein
VRSYDLLLGPLTGRARLVDHLDEATGQLRVELAARQEVDVELEALQTLVARVQDLVLGSADGSSSLETSMSIVAELLEGWIDVAAANGVYWGSRSTLVATVSHFSELKTELEVLESKPCADLTEGEVDALWIWVHVASDSLTSHVPSSVVHNPPDGMEE